MSRTTDDTGDGDQIPEHVRKTYEAMETIKHQTAILLKQVDAMSTALGTAPPKRETPKDKGVASSTTDGPLSVSGTELPPASMNADRDRMVNECVSIIMDQIQPLLASLEKISTEQSAPRQLTEAEYVSKMCDEMSQRVARRRGFAPAIAKNVNLERYK